MSPLHFIHKNDMVYSLDKTPADPLNINSNSNDYDVLPDEHVIDPAFILLNTRVKNGVVDEDSLKKAKEFVITYYSKALHKMLEDDWATHAEDRSLKSIDFEDGELPVNYTKMVAALKPHYKKHGPEESGARLKIITNTIRKLVDGITPDVIIADHQKIHPSVPESQATEIKQKQTEDNITKTFQQLPEWMQVLVHESGAYVLTALSDAEQKHLHGQSLTSNDMIMPMIKLNPDYVEKVGEDLKKTLREELLHSFQHISDGHENVEIEKKTKGQSFKEAMQDLEKKIIRIEAWQQAANQFHQRILQEQDKSEALQLIKKTEPHGGSLTNRNAQNNRTLFAAELLVDIFDAEYYLRKKEGKTKAQAADELSHVFGDEIYAIAQSYLQEWMQNAEAKLTAKIGRDKAEQYYTKWKENPFDHNISINRLPEYKANANAVAQQ